MTLEELVGVAPSPIHGCGVFARQDLVLGSFIGTYDGTATAENGRHVLWVEDGDRWIGRDGSPPLKFLNHAHQPNAEFDGFDLYALRDIVSGEEITFDYGEEWRQANPD